ncbi:MAG: MFS transporter [Armatimonadota bacterium]
MKVTACTDKVAFGQKMAYAFGAVAYNFLGNGIGMLALPIYNVALGLNASIIGLALGIPRVIDAFLDPLVGHISDNTRSKLGRRRPYIIIGGILAGLIFALLWNPNPHWSSNSLFVFFLIVTMLYYVLLTVWSIPYGALGYELSYDYVERTNIQAYKTFVGNAFAIAMPWMYEMCFWNWGALTAPGNRSIAHRLGSLVQHSSVHGAEIHGVGIVGIIIGGVILITAVIPALCREKIEAQSQTKSNFLHGLKCTLKNKAFVILSVSSFISFLGIFLVQPIGLYINIYYIFGGDRAAAARMSGWTGTFYFLAAVLCVPLMTKMANVIGKKSALLFGLGFTMLGTVMIWWLYTPVNPWLQLIPIAFFTPAWTAVQILTASMAADVCDVDELETGLRREGMYGAMTSWMVKLGIGGVTCVSGCLITFAGVRPEAVTQTATTIFKLRALFVGLPAFFLIAALIIAAYYPITEARAREVRAILDERKKTAMQDDETASSVR